MQSVQLDRGGPHLKEELIELEDSSHMIYEYEEQKEAKPLPKEKKKKKKDEDSVKSDS